MEHGVVAAVDSIPPVDICADQPSIAFVRVEDIGLMSGSMSSENRVLVDIVRIGFTPARMVSGKA